jgi:uncharacterized protein YlzI (FlbEa/FlbD family)
MLKFVKLNEICGNDTIRAFILNADLIQHITNGNKGKDTYIKLTNQEFFFVKESLDVILNMLQTDTSKPPMLVDRELAKELGLV